MGSGSWSLSNEFTKKFIFGVDNNTLRHIENCEKKSFSVG